MDLCIIGGGPVGLEMAVSAIQRKLSVTLIEKVISMHNIAIFGHGITTVQHTVFFNSFQRMLDSFACIENVYVLSGAYRVLISATTFGSGATLSCSVATVSTCLQTVEKLLRGLHSTTTNTRQATST